MLQKELYLHGLTKFQRQICHKATVIWKKPIKNKVSWQITFQITLAKFPLFHLIIENGLAHGLIVTFTRKTCTRRTLRKLCQQLFLLNNSDINLDVLVLTTGSRTNQSTGQLIRPSFSDQNFKHKDWLERMWMKSNVRGTAINNIIHEALHNCLESPIV
jgi:hypothetical protein